MKKLVLVCFLFLNVAYSKDRLVIFGGGGESPYKSSTLFDRNLQDFSDYANQSAYETSLYFNGGHENTDKIRNGFSKAIDNQNFNQNSFNDMLDRLLKDISDNKIKKDEQIFLYISGHGEKASEEQGAHAIAGSGAISNLINFNNTERINLNLLQGVIDAAEAKGIKLALYDSSCFSGSTLKLKAKKTCIITSSGPNHFSYMTNPLFGKSDSQYKEMLVFNDLMSRGLKLKKYSNLEDLFLASRKESFGADFPMANTSAATAAQALLYKDISDYLELEATNFNTIKDVIGKLKTEKQICDFENNFQKITFKIEELSKSVAKAIGRDRSVFNDLLKSISEYHQVIIAQAHANLVLEKYNAKYIEIPLNGVSSKVEMRAFLSADYGEALSELEKNRDEELKNSNLTMQQRQEILSQFAAQISKIQNALKVRENLVGSNKDLKAAFLAIQEWNKRDDRFATLAFDIGVRSRKVYDLLYKTKLDNNACRDFKI
jgi:hypothetical protein